jgi:hypothetical protein
MVGEDTETIHQLKDEPVYKIELASELIAYDIFTNEPTVISENSVIYAFYSSITGNDPDYYQFIYNKSGNYKIDENGIVHNVGNYYCKKN